MTNTPGRCGFLLALGLAMMTGAAGASEVVREFRGDRDTTTGSFVVDAPWVIEWRVGSDFPQSARFELWLVDAMTGFNDSRVMLIKSTGSGTKLFSEGGRIRLRVNASYADWYLKIRELSESEAKEYVALPKPWER